MLTKNISSESATRLAKFFPYLLFKHIIVKFVLKMITLASNISKKNTKINKKQYEFTIPYYFFYNNQQTFY